MAPTLLCLPQVSALSSDAFGGLTDPPHLLYNMEVTWKGGRVVEGSSLEN